MLTLSNKGRLWTNLGMENAKDFYMMTKFQKYVVFCCGKQQATDWANLPWFAMGRVQVRAVEQRSPLRSTKVNLALDVNHSCGARPCLLA